MRKLSLMLALICSSFAFAQLPQPGPEISALKWMVGDWTSEGKFTMMGSEMPYTAEWTVTMEGPFLKSVSKMNMMGMTLIETGYTHWDKAKKQYVMTTYTNFSDMPRIERGTMTGSVLTMLSDPWEAMGQPASSRSTLSKVSDDVLQFKLEMKAGDGWETASNDQFKRKKK
ncbi:MAG: DUF1579 family protein [Fimbriimonadaceae bacterium]|nr:MAG: DUF1579 family protein [Fimbriimonadaceae bacterium]